MIDALHMVVGKLRTDTALSKEQDEILLQAGYDVTRLQANKRLVLITGHRRENFGDGFIRMVTAMKDLSEKYPNVDFVYPMHLNPNVRKPIREVFGEDLTRPNFSSLNRCNIWSLFISCQSYNCSYRFRRHTGRSARPWQARSRDA